MKLTHSHHADAHPELEIKRNSITRLKQEGLGFVKRSRNNLKSKETRLRDWNASNGTVSGGDFPTWNQKKLDYEIETAEFSRYACSSAMSTWNQKKLDYEIETGWYPNLPARFWVTWNQKKLDYEIETEKKF